MKKKNRKFKEWAFANNVTINLNFENGLYAISQNKKVM